MNKKALSLPILISLVVGNMIGTGIYVLPASLASYGTISILSWAYTSVGTMLLAITFANLSKRFPKTGGPYVYCREAYGKPIGFMIAYTYWGSNMVSVAGIAIASVGYLGFLLPFLDAGSPAYDADYVLVIELAIIWLFTMINCIGIHAAGVIQVFLTLIKVSPLLIIALIGMWYIQPSNLLNFTPPDNQGNLFTAMSSAATLTLWAFIGFESATIPAENTRGPKDIYKATIFGTLITSIIYILSTVVLMGMVPASDLANSQYPFALAGTLLFGPSAAIIITLCAVISGLGALNVSVMIQGQMVYAGARDHLFPSHFARLSKNDAPIMAQLLSSSLVSLFLIMTIQPTLLAQFNTIILLAALLTLITYLVTALSEIKFLLKDSIAMRKKSIKKSFIIALLATAYALWMISNLPHTILFLGSLLTLCCLLLYFTVIRKFSI